MILTEKGLTDYLREWLSHHKVVAHYYYFGWESDILVLTNSGLLWEIEIKTSRRDFYNDFHKLVQFRIFNNQRDTNQYKHGLLKKVWNGLEHPNDRQEVPNRFFFAIPDGVIEPNDVPEYAGLITFRKYGAFVQRKLAPILHKDNVINYERLFNKLYFETSWMRKEVRRKYSKF